jgi:hypothetical protein
LFVSVKADGVEVEAACGALVVGEDLGDDGDAFVLVPAEAVTANG